MLKHIAAGALLALALAGCAFLQPEEKLAPPPQAPEVELTKQQGGRFISLVGPRRQHTQEFLGVSDTNYFTLRSWLDNKTGESAHQLYVEDSYYGGPFNWNGVRDGDEKELKFIPISRNQISCDEGCAYADEFAAELSEGYLRAHREGFAATFTAADGKKLPVTVPGPFVTAQVNALDAVRQLAATTAGPAAAPPATPASSTTAPPPAKAAPAPTVKASTDTLTPPASVKPAAARAIPPGTVVPPPPAGGTLTPPK